MPWYWVGLTAVVRLLFLRAPFLGVSDEFAIPDEFTEEAQDYARAGACKAILLSFPVLQLINLLAAADRDCGQAGVAPFPIALIVVVGVVLEVLVYYIPARYYRGSHRSFVWFAGVTLADVLLVTTGIPRVDLLLCK